MLKRMHGRLTDAQYDVFFANLDLAAIIEQAQKLRPRHSCQISPRDIEKKNLIAHGTNIHFPLTFDDGRKWMVRVRQTIHARAPRDVMRMTALSEVATYKALRDGGVPVPQAWVPKMSDDPNASIYTFIEFIDGQPYEPIFDTFARVPTDLTIKHIYKVAEWFLELEKVHFDAACSFHFDPLEPGMVVIGPLLKFQPQKNTPPYFNGPYRTAMEHYADFFDHAMRQILAGTRSVAERDVDDYLIALEAKSLVLGCEEMGEGPWYMKHADDHKGDHFLFTDDGELSGVIDWDWAYTSSKGDAFTPPVGFSVPDFWNGSNAISPREAALMDAYMRLERADLAELVKNSKKYRRRHELTQGPFPCIKEVRHVQRAFRDEPDPKGGEQVGTDDDWRLQMREKFKDDVGLQVVLDRHAARNGQAVA